MFEIPDACNFLRWKNALCNATKPFDILLKKYFQWNYMTKNIKEYLGSLLRAILENMACRHYNNLAMELYISTGRFWWNVLFCCLLEKHSFKHLVFLLLYSICLCLEAISLLFHYLYFLCPWRLSRLLCNRREYLATG